MYWGDKLYYAIRKTYPTSAGNHSASKHIGKIYMSIKSTIAAVAASPFLLAGAAFAGPYVNVESNASLTGSDYTGATTDVHIGYEGTVGTAAYYIQGGPAVIAQDGVDGTKTQFSGKAGLGAPVSEALDLYGEVSFLTAEGDTDNGYGAKVGAKFKF